MMLNERTDNKESLWQKSQETPKGDGLVVSEELSLCLLFKGGCLVPNDNRSQHGVSFLSNTQADMETMSSGTHIIWTVLL